MKKILSILFCCIFCVVAKADVVYVDVTARAFGVNEEDATLSALNKCVAQVCGLAIASETFHSFSEKSLDTSSSSEYMSANIFLNKIKTKTDGVIASYSLLSCEEADGGVEVEVSASVAKYETLQLNRKKIAVVPLLGSKQIWNIDGKPSSLENVSRVLTQSLVNYFTSTRKFAILDREYSTVIETELDFMTKNSIDPADLCKRYSTTGTDYLFYAVIEELSVEKEKVVLANISNPIERKIAKASISYRVADVATRQILASNTINIREPISLNSVSPITDLANAFAKLAVLEISENIYPIRVVGINNGKELVLNQGSLLVEKDAQYNIYLAGETLIDPYTKEGLGKQESLCGSIKIIESKAKTSTAIILDSTIDFNNISLAENRILCRFIKKAPKDKPAASIKALEKEIEDKW